MWSLFGILSLPLPLPLPTACAGEYTFVDYYIAPTAHTLCPLRLGKEALEAQTGVGGHQNEAPLKKGRRQWEQQRRQKQPPAGLFPL